MLLVSMLTSWTWIGPAIMFIIGLIEGIIYLAASDEDFYATYVQSKKKWF
jgi:hypothetical protein